MRLTMMESDELVSQDRAETLLKAAKVEKGLLEASRCDINFKSDMVQWSRNKRGCRI